MGQAVFESTVTTGSVWLRSDEYYRRIEDEARRDLKEGFTAGGCTVPLSLPTGPAGGRFIVEGEGSVGQFLPPHYILSLHGSCISTDQRASFGGYTLGVKSVSRLAHDIAQQAGPVVGDQRVGFGPVFYRRTALSVTTRPIDGAAIVFGDPRMHLTVWEPDPSATDATRYFRKDPVWPFIEQDEWRIVLLTDRYVDDDPDAPLRLTVDPAHFYRYLIPE